MLKITISKTVSRTYAMGNYENYKPSITITEEFEAAEPLTKEQYKVKLDNISQILHEELKKEKEKLPKVLSKK